MPSPDDRPATLPEPAASPRPAALGGPIETWRRIVLALVVAGSGGIAAELGLLGHYEDWSQRIPLLVLGAGMGAGVWAGMRPSRPSIRLLQGLMAAFAASGVLGVYFHFRSNFDFEVEMLMETLPARAADPPLASLELVAESLRGALPTLAPLAMLQLGLLGLLAGWRHPRLSSDIRVPPSGLDRPVRVRSRPEAQNGSADSH